MRRYTVHWHAEMRRWDRWGVWVVKRDGEEVRTFPLAGMSTPAMKAAYDEARSWAHEQNQREEQTA